MAGTAVGGIAGNAVAAAGTAIGSGTRGGSSTRANGTAGVGVAAGRVETGVSVTGGTGARAATGGVPADDVIVGFEALVFAAIGFVVLEPFALGVAAASGVDREGLDAGSGAGVGRSARAGALRLSFLRSPVSELSLTAAALAGGGSLASSSSSGSMRSSVWSSLGPTNDFAFGAGTVTAGGVSALSPADGLLNAKASRGVSTGRSGSGSGSGRDLGSIMCEKRPSAIQSPILQRAREQANLPAHRSQCARPRIVTSIALPP